MPEAHLRCQARRGLFDEEMIVTIPIVTTGNADKEAECYAWSDSVRLDTPLRGDEKVEATLRVGILHGQGREVAVVLPQEMFHGSNVAMVRTENLVGSK